MANGKSLRFIKMSDNKNLVLSLVEKDGSYSKLPINISQDGNNYIDADKVDGRHASDFSLANHNHDDRYYTESETNNLLYYRSNVRTGTVNGSIFTVTMTATSLSNGGQLMLLVQFGDSINIVSMAITNLSTSSSYSTSGVYIKPLMTGVGNSWLSTVSNNYQARKSGTTIYLKISLPQSQSNVVAIAVVFNPGYVISNIG